MGRSGKDLFVILAERQNRRSGKSTANQPRQRKSDDGAGDGVARTLGRWVQSAVRTVRGTTDDPPRRRRSTRSRGPQQVPRGLLLPGWMLAAMILVALGGGFALGRFTSGVGGGDELDVKRDPITPRKFSAAESGALAPADEESMLDTFFYVVQTHPPDDRNGAARLAQYIRGVGGIERTRIHAFRDKKGSIASWGTLCFVASSTKRDPKSGKLLCLGADAERVFELLDRVSVPEFDDGTSDTKNGYPAFRRGVVSLSPSR